MRRAKWAGAVLVAGLVVPWCAAQTKSGRSGPAGKAAGPTVAQILERYARAIGGEAAYRKLTSRQAAGVLESPDGGQLPFILLAKAPDKLYFEMQLSAQAKLVQAFDGNVAWDYNPEDGLRTLSGNPRANRYRNAQFYREIELRRLYPKMELRGMAQIGSLDAYVVDCTPEEGYAEKFYFAAESGLLLRRDGKLEADGQVFEVATYYEDYRQVDGVMLPFAIRRTGSEGAFVLRFTQIQHNVAVEDSRFTRPQ